MKPYFYWLLQKSQLARDTCYSLVVVISLPCCCDHTYCGGLLEEWWSCGLNTLLVLITISGTLSFQKPVVLQTILPCFYFYESLTFSTILQFTSLVRVISAAVIILCKDMDKSLLMVILMDLLINQKSLIKLHSSPVVVRILV